MVRKGKVEGPAYGTLDFILPLKQSATANHLLSGFPVKTKIVLGLALVLASPSLAQTHSPDPGAMKCADYVRGAKGSTAGLGSVKTGDAEADAMIAEMGRKTLKVCTANPTITVREAIQKAIIEEE